MKENKKLYLNNEEFYSTGNKYLDIAAAVVRCSLQDIEKSLDIYLKCRTKRTLSHLKGEIKIATTPFMDVYLMGKQRVIDIIPDYLRSRTIQKDDQEYKKYNQSHIELVLKLAKE